MEHRSAIEKIVTIEEQLDVNAIRHRDIHLWPLIRIEIWRYLLRQDLGVGLEALHLAVPTHPIKRLRQALKDWQKLALTPKIHFNPVDIVFYSMPIYYTDRFEQGFYHRQLDPLIEHVHDNGWHTIKLELHQPETNRTQPRVYPTTFLDLKPYLARQRLLHNIGFSYKLAPEQLAMLNQSLNEILGDSPFTEDILSKLIQTLEIYIHLFTDVLIQLKPHAVFLTTYYHLPCMGLICAARRLGIPTVDVQHGKQGKYHAAYNHWLAIPEDGYLLLPDYFWVWGEESQKNILIGREANPHVHVPLIGGNLWLSRWISGQIDYQPPQASQDFYQRLKRASKCILISLQPPHPYIPDIILKAIQQSDPSWLWLIRLHPRSIQDKPAILAQLAHYGLSERVECDLATQEPLYAILRHTHHHITRFSTVCYEALYFNIPTTLIGTEARDLYADYIERGTFYYANTADELLQSIVVAKTQHFTPEITPYIETRAQAAEAALEHILGRHNG